MLLAKRMAHLPINMGTARALAGRFYSISHSMGIMELGHGNWMWLLLQTARWEGV